MTHFIPWMSKIIVNSQGSNFTGFTVSNMIWQPHFNINFIVTSHDPAFPHPLLADTLSVATVNELCSVCLVIKVVFSS